jgi:L-ascorbate metabolism protein UlaG (beta-lactamase superfamily)
MRSYSKPLSPVILFLVFASACAPAPAPPSVAVHYLGHASFLLTFDDSLTVLTDYGESNAYGLDSPVYDLGTVRPHLVTLSHEHADHAGGQLPDDIGPLITGGEGLQAGGLTATPIPGFERSLDEPDNTSYVFEFRGLRVLHLGDCQALMLGLDEPGIRHRIGELYPDTYDLVLLPIGFVSDILSEAAAFVTLLDARRVVPMHYWSPADRERFLDMMADRADAGGRPYRVQRTAAARLVFGPLQGPIDTIDIVGLDPAPAVAAVP